MPSARRLAANRANAAKSTGPKSAKGRARAAQNARRHGLRAAQPSMTDAAAALRLAEALREGDPELTLETALGWAEAVVRKEEIQRLKQNLVESALEAIDRDLPEDFRRDVARLSVLKQLLPLS